ncbi:MAG: hypothetical protein IJ537_09655 [Bacteroidaceae bacterium]|nr:hypothetical protein [Bacteroidaceae bacterium]
MRLSIKHSALMAMAIALVLVSCRDDDLDTVKGEYTTNTCVRTVLLTDQMDVKVTNKLLASVPSAFDEGSTGAALVKRLQLTISEISPNARLVLLKGSDFGASSSAISPEDMRTIARIYAGGGYVGLVRPTNEQLGTFGIALMASLLEIEQTTLESTFQLTDEQAAKEARRSRAVERLNARIKNIQSVSTRSDNEDGNDVDNKDINPSDLSAEILILGPTEYFMQEPVTDEEAERTPYISGELADAAAEWLNEVEEKLLTTSRQAVHGTVRADAPTAINQLIDASETFTISGHINYRDDENKTWTEYGIVNHKFLSWGVHDMNSNKDYYYIQQNVLLKLWSLYHNYSWSAGTTSEWMKATGYGDYDRWYGAYLSQFETSMALAGNGNITLEDALPYTDNNTSTSSISVGTSSSTSVGITGGINSQGVFNAGMSLGWTTGTSFTMTSATTAKDLAVIKNTSGNSVYWTYKAGLLPKAYVETGGNVLVRKYYYKHTTPADILINDCNIKNEGCWSVSDPKDNYKLIMRARPQTAALLFSYKNSSGDDMPSKTEYTDGTSSTLEHTLLVPNRATQMWSMNVTINKWADGPVTGAKAQLESTLAEKYPDAFRQRFSAADVTPTSINTITAYINYSRSVFQSFYEDLQAYAAELGILQFTINWKCNDTSLSPKEGFCVTVTNFNGTVSLPLLTADYEAQNEETLTGKLAGRYKITIADGATVTLRDAEIKGEKNSSTNYRWAGITCLGDATIILEGTNTISGMHGSYPGIFVPKGSTLTIQGDGTLNVSCGIDDYGGTITPYGNASGIGSSRYEPAGNIVIAGGTINATGGDWSAGIGSCYDKECAGITITGGNVTALGGSKVDREGDGPGIGSGSGTSCGDILISGGTIVSQGSSYSSAIGSAWQGSCGKITITSGVASLTATKGTKSPNSIGAGYEGTCGTITIGGNTSSGITTSPYTYKP